MKNSTNRLFNDENNHVDFYSTETYFSVVIYNANYVDPEKGKEKGKELIQQILFEISRNQSITVAQLAENLGVTEKTIRYHMNKLRDEGKIEREGSTKSGKWIINNK